MERNGKKSHGGGIYFTGQTDVMDVKCTFRTATSQYKDYKTRYLIQVLQVSELAVVVMVNQETALCCFYHHFCSVCIKSINKICNKHKVLTMKVMVMMAGLGHFFQEYTGIVLKHRYRNT